jgi:hypothetical protein
MYIFYNQSNCQNIFCIYCTTLSQLGIASNVSIIDWLIGKDLEGSSHDLIEVLPLESLWTTTNTYPSLIKVADDRPRLEPGILQV